MPVLFSLILRASGSSVREVIDIEGAVAFGAFVLVPTVNGAFCPIGDELGDLNAVGLLADVMNLIATAMPANRILHETCTLL